jgi:tricorn protease
LTADWTGTSRDPMFWNGRVYFLSDRDGVMNVYSMDEQGHGVKQESHQRLFDIASFSVSDGHAVYACGGDLWLLDLKTAQEAKIAVSLISDFDQLREHWVKKPLDYVTDAHLAPDGSERGLFTARGEVFTLASQEWAHRSRLRVTPPCAIAKPGFCRMARASWFFRQRAEKPNSGSIRQTAPAPPEQWTHDSKVLRWEGLPSPDGRWLAHRDKDQQLWVYDIKTKQDKRIAQSMVDDFRRPQLVRG